MRATCDVTVRYRWIYVRVDYTQRSLIAALESREMDQMLTSLRITKGTNLAFGECKLRFPSNMRSLAGCDVTLVVRPGAFRFHRGKSTVELYAAEVKVIRRPWWAWCVG